MSRFVDLESENPWPAFRQALTFFTVFYTMSGIIGYTLRHEAWRGPPWSAWLVGLVVLLIFCLSIALLLHLFIQGFSPKPTVQIDRKPILGECIQITWNVRLLPWTPRRFSLAVMLHENFTLQRFGDSEHQSKLLHSECLIETTNPCLMRSGIVEASIPADSFCSIKTPNFELKWEVQIKLRSPVKLCATRSYPFSVRQA